MLGEETFPCEQSAVLKRNIQFRNVGEDRIALAFEKRSMGVAHHRAVDDAGGDRLRARAGVTDDSKGDPVAFGLNAPMLEGKHGEHPVAAAEAGHTDPFAFQIRWGFDVVADSEGTHQSIDEPGNENAVEAVQKPLLSSRLRWCRSKTASHRLSKLTGRGARWASGPTARPSCICEKSPAGAR